MIALGVAMIVVTLAHGGSASASSSALLFIAAGVGRLYMLRRRR